MAQSSNLLLRLVASSTMAANAAGKIIQEVMQKGDLGIVEKSKNDPQTEADRLAQQCIITSLSHQFPNITIIGEEGDSTFLCPEELIIMKSDPDILSLQCPDQYKDVSELDVTLWVDPLDGTSEYTQGLLDHVTVLIGIAIKDKAVAGVIHQPYYNYKLGEATMGRTIWGIDGIGVGGFVPKSPPQDKCIITTTRSHFTPQVQAALDALRPDEVLKVGGAGNKALLLMDGIAHVYLFASTGTKRWDTCAPEAILNAVGGKLTDMHGQNYSYAKDTSHVNTGGIIATADAKKHDFYLNEISKNIK